MGKYGLLTFLVLLVSTMVLCSVYEEIREDIFNVYKGVTVMKMDITNTEVTREKITFRLFRKQHKPRRGVVLHDYNLNLLNGTKSKIVFLTHGWTDRGDSAWLLDLKNSFLDTYPNWVVITVDWNKPALQVYHQSAICVEDVGNIIGDTVAELVKDHGLKISQFILVGHSLGGQVCGFAGKRLQEVHKLKLHRIVALDPAGPLFRDRPEKERLNPTDAKVVMAIHSDRYFFGFTDPCGTIDFFPNGGDNQPGCTRIDINILDPSSALEPVVCDHLRAYYFYIEAVRNPKDYLMGVKCSEWSLLFKVCDNDVQVAMGDLKTTRTGNFYLETNENSPFNKPCFKG